MSDQAKKASVFALPKTIWAIGFVTLLLNISGVIVFSLSPLYLTTVLGVSVAGVGLLEGIVESISWFTRLFSGVISDYLHKRKPLLLVAVSFTVLSRPLFAMANDVSMVFASRTLDRIGNGLQATPREALVGDAAPKTLKGTSFGLRQALSVLGSMIGALFIYIVSYKTDFSFKTIFWLASIPPVLAILILMFFVRDPVSKALERKKESLSTIVRRCTSLNAGYWKVVLVAFVFMLSNYSGSFLILRVTDGVNNMGDAALTMVFQNLASMICAYPAGKLSDIIDRRWILGIGFIVAIISNGFLSMGSGVFFGLIGATLWGAQLGIVQSVFMTKITDHTSQDMRATAFGVYYVLIAIAVLGSNKIMGVLYDSFNPAIAFHGSSAFALAALFLLPFVKSPLILKHH